MANYTAVTGYLHSVWDCRHFWFSLVKLDVQSRYRRSVLGLGWSLLNPIAMTAVLALVFHIMLKMDVRHYVPYLLSGMAVWTYLTSVMLEGCQSLLAGERYIRCHPAPMAIYPLRTVLATGFHFLLTVAVALVVSWAALGFGNLPFLVSLLPGGVLLFLFGWSMAILLGFANVYFPDTHHIAQIGLQLLFYLSGVFYTPEMMHGSRLFALIEFNPLYSLVRLVRDPIRYGQVPSATTFAACLLTVLATGLAAAYVLARHEKKVIFHM